MLSAADHADQVMQDSACRSDHTYTMQSAECTEALTNTLLSSLCKRHLGKEEDLRNIWVVVQ